MATSGTDWRYLPLRKRCEGKSPQNMALQGTVPPFRILKCPDGDGNDATIGDRTHICDYQAANIWTSYGECEQSV